MKFLEKIKKNNISILFFLTLICMTIGFAAYNENLKIRGSASLVPGGVISIKSVNTVSLTNASANPEIIHNNTSIDFNLSFTTIKRENITYEAAFDVTISNQTFNDFVFNMPDYKLEVLKVVDNGYEAIDPAFAGWKITNADIGDKIPAKGEKSFRIVFSFSNPEESGGITYLINSEFTPSVSNDADAILMGSVADSETGDLTGTNQRAKFSMQVINTHSVEQTFTINVKNTDKFLVENANIEYTIPANSEDNFEFYLARVDGVEFPYDSTNVDIVIISQGVSYSTGSVTVLVDQTIIINDTTPPTISNVTAEILNTEGSAQLSWDAEDDVKVEDYIIYVYKQNGDVFEKYDEIDMQSIEKSATIADLPEGIYYFVVCGVDNSGNTAAQEDIDSATTAAGYASRSEEIELRWNYNVTITVQNLTHNGNSTVKRGETYTVTFEGKTAYSAPESLNSVTMGGQAYSNYTYQDGVVTIPNVTGDIEISASGTLIFCLVEGTQVLLADGSYKNIEDIEYTDLLAVYDHLNGGITYVYPVWIEKEGNVTSMYQKITFDDGTVIKIAGRHCLFDCEKNKYVDVSNKEEFDIGSKVFKVEDSKLKEVKAINIEYIEEKVRYYDVLSTTNYNIIANNLITTDIITQYANILYDFDDEAVFKNFDIVSNSQQLDYNNFKYIPYNLFKGCNLNNTLYLTENSGMDMKSLGKFLIDRGKEQTTKNGERYYMITTSNDDINSRNIDDYLYKEQSTYIFPKIGAKYYIDTATNKMYKAGDSFVVHNSTHFKVIY